MGAKLVVSDQGKETILDMSVDELWVGRAPDCALRVDDGQVSRKHAVLRRLQDKYMIEDLLSANGTFVNEQRVRGIQALAPDDVIRCGSVVVRLVIEAEAPEAPPSGFARPSGPLPAMPEATPVPAAAAFAPTVDAAAPVPAETGALEAVTQERDELRQEMEKQRVAISEGRAARHENEALKRRVDDLTTQLADVDELRRNERHQTEDLHADLARITAERDAAREALISAEQGSESRARRVSQLEAEISKMKDEADKLRVDKAELSRIKDDGWNQVNAAIHEAEHLREVIKQQTALLEEQKVAIMVLEATRKR